MDTSFLSAQVPTSLNIEQILQVYLYPGCITVKEQKVYIDINGLKYFFSALVSSRVAQYDNFDVLDPKQSKFINWVLKFDFDQFVLKAHGLLADSSVPCNFCRFFPADIEGFTNVSSREEYLVCLAKVAGQELCQVIERDNKETQKVSQSAPLASYNAIDDWQSSS